MAAEGGEIHVKLIPDMSEVKRVAKVLANQNPSVGRIVHYVSHGTPGGEYKSECRAAIITEVDLNEQKDDGACVGLCILNPTGQFFNQHVCQHEGDMGHDHDGAEIPARSYRGGSWHWPERV